MINLIEWMLVNFIQFIVGFATISPSWDCAGAARAEDMMQTFEPNHHTNPKCRRTYYKNDGYMRIQGKGKFVGNYSVGMERLFIVRI